MTRSRAPRWQRRWAAADVGCLLAHQVSKGSIAAAPAAWLGRPRAAGRGGWVGATLGWEGCATRVRRAAAGRRQVVRACALMLPQVPIRLGRPPMVILRLPPCAPKPADGLPLPGHCVRHLQGDGAHVREGRRAAGERERRRDRLEQRCAAPSSPTRPGAARPCSVACLQPSPVPRWACAGHALPRRGNIPVPPPQV